MHRATTIVAQVDDELLGTTLLQVEKGATEVFRRTLKKLCVVDETDVALLHAVVGQVGHLYGFACNLHGELLACGGAQHL